MKLLLRRYIVEVSAKTFLPSSSAQETCPSNTGSRIRQLEEPNHQGREESFEGAWILRAREASSQGVYLGFLLCFPIHLLTGQTKELGFLPPPPLKKTLSLVT